MNEAGAEDEADAGGEGRAQDAVGEDRHLDRRDRTEVVEDERVVGAAGGQGREQAVGHDRDEAVGVGQRDALDARLAVDAEAEFGLGVGDALVVRLPRDGAGAEREAERADVGGGGAGGGGDRGERRAGVGEVTGDLVDEERAGDAARLDEVRQGDVVGDDDRLDGEALGAGALGGEAEVEPVAGVVLDDEQAAGRAGGGADAGEDGGDRRRGEDLAGDRGGEHAGADEAGVRGLVAGAAAGDDGDLGRVAVGAEHDLDLGGAVEADELAAGGGDQAVERLGDDGLAGVDEVLAAHGVSLAVQRRRRR